MDKRNRVNLTIDDDTAELLQRVAKHSGMTPAAVISKLLLAHLEEMWEFCTWMDGLPEGMNPLRHRGTHFLDSYGPGTLIDDIKKVDPSYKTGSERFAESVREPRQEGDA